MFYVYALYSVKWDRIYIGYTSNIENRLKSHNHPSKRGFTGKFQPWELFYLEEYLNKRSAMKREKELKTFKGREFIRSLIK